MNQVSRKALGAFFLALCRGIGRKRNATYTKHFTAGISVLEVKSPGIHKTDVKGEWLFVPSDAFYGRFKVNKFAWKES